MSRYSSAVKVPDTPPDTVKVAVGLAEVPGTIGLGAAISSGDTNYDFGTPVVGMPGDTYKLCWGHEPRGLAYLADYNIELDPDGILEGTFADDFACTLGPSVLLSFRNKNRTSFRLVCKRKSPCRALARTRLCVRGASSLAVHDE